MKKIQVTAILLFVTVTLSAQEDFSWWNEKHNWDGHTSWVQYMTMSSSFMGPNSLPVPEMTKGRIDSVAELDISGEYYFSDGDKTKDFFLRGYFPLYENRVAVSMYVVPYEWYEMDTTTRDLRAARTKSGKGGAGGDIYLSSEYQIIRDKIKWPDISFRLAYRLASGTKLRNARFTDGPGYFFDAGAGKNFGRANLIFRPMLMIGFYAYQTYDLQHQQNDCLMFGAGIDIVSKRVVISESFAGYNGYLGIGDKPLVYRMSVRLKNKIADYKIGFQTGLNDYDYRRISAGIVFHLAIR